MQKVYHERAREVEVEREDELARQLEEEVSFEDMLSTPSGACLRGLAWHGYPPVQPR